MAETVTAEDYSRDELNKTAEQHGPNNADKYPNKPALAEPSTAFGTARTPLP